jgi:hypothetical protein
MAASAYSFNRNLAARFQTEVSRHGQIGQFLERHAGDCRVVEGLAIALTCSLFIRSASDEFEYCPFGYHGGYSLPPQHLHLRIRNWYGVLKLATVEKLNGAFEPGSPQWLARC